MMSLQFHVSSCNMYCFNVGQSLYICLEICITEKKQLRNVLLCTVSGHGFSVLRIFKMLISLMYFNQGTFCFFLLHMNHNDCMQGHVHASFLET